MSEASTRVRNMKMLNIMILATLFASCVLALSPKVMEKKLGPFTIPKLSTYQGDVAQSASGVSDNSPISIASFQFSMVEVIDDSDNYNPVGVRLDSLSLSNMDQRDELCGQDSQYVLLISNVTTSFSLEFPSNYGYFCGQKDSWFFSFSISNSRDTDVENLYIQYVTTYFVNPNDESILPITPIVISAMGQCNDPLFDIKPDPSAEWFTLASTYKPNYQGNILMAYPVLDQVGLDLILQRIKTNGSEEADFRAQTICETSPGRKSSPCEPFSISDADLLGVLAVYKDNVEVSSAIGAWMLYGDVKIKVPGQDTTDGDEDGDEDGMGKEAKRTGTIVLFSFSGVILCVSLTVYVAYLARKDHRSQVVTL